MSKLLRSLLALLAAMAMVLVWSGTATAEDPPQTPEECLLTADDPMTCLPPDLPLVEEPVDDGEGPPEDGEGGDIEVPEVLPLPEEIDDPTVTQPDITRRVGQNEPEGEAPVGAAEREAAAENEEPDPAVIADCIATELEALIAALEDALEGATEELVAEIEEGLDPENLEGLPAFLEGLPALVEESAPELAEELGELLPGTIEGIVACLPEPPSEEPPGGNPPPEEPPTATPIGNQDPEYDNCDDVRSQRSTPIYASEPGYGPHLDRDGDGIGCEEDTVVPVTHTGGLAYTGAEVAPQLKLGAILLLLGSGLLFATRRRA